MAGIVEIRDYTIEAGGLIVIRFGPKPLFPG